MSKVSMVFWDVQHGHATYINTPNSRHIVVDLGTGSYDDNNQEFSPLSELRDTYKIGQLDYVIITHPHLDHIDDILNFDSLSPKVLSRPKQITNELIQEKNKGCPASAQKKYDKYCEINNRYNATISDDSPNNAANPDNWGGMKILRFHPDSCDINNFNNHSILTVIEHGGIKVLIPGDNEVCSLEELMKKETFKAAVKNADILLAPHHGRESAYHNDFVTLANPRLTIVSDGSICDTSANARYGAKSRGWTVHKLSDGSNKTRKCLTTNSDGEIFVEFGPNSTGGNFLYVAVK